MIIINEKAKVTDDVLGVTSRKAQVVGVTFTINKRSVSADYMETNSYNYRIKGCPPQNEEGTLDACEKLVHHLNQ